MKNFKLCVVGLVIVFDSFANAAVWTCSDKSGNSFKGTISEDSAEGSVGEFFSFGEIPVKLDHSISGEYRTLSGRVGSRDTAYAEVQLIPDLNDSAKGKVSVTGTTDIDCLGVANYDFVLDCQVSN